MQEMEIWKNRRKEKMSNNKLLFTRKYNGGTYKFYLCTMISWVDGNPRKYFSIETPENCFGYPDYVHFDNNGNPYTLHRYLQPWILKKIKEAVIKMGYEEYM